MRLTVLLFLALSLAGASAADKFPGVEKLMSKKEKQQTGIDQLTEEQIQHLDQWLARYTAQEAPQIKAHNKEVRKIAQQDIKSSIVGRFTGWDGKTKFKLANGQVWQQRYGRKFKTDLMDPEVVISKTLIGSYEMLVVPADKATGVKRIK